VLKWLMVVVVSLLLLGWLTPLLSRLGFGRLPGDLRWQRRGRVYSVPLTSTLLLSIAVTLLSWVFRL
jgi:hypothetical protein